MSYFKNFAIFLFIPNLSACTMNTKSVYVHYNECESITSSFIEYASCGKKARNEYCTENGNCSVIGNNYVKFADLLSDQVANGGISDIEARLELLKYEDRLIADAQRREREAYRDLSNSLNELSRSLEASQPTYCSTTGSTYGGTYSGSTYCY